MPEFAPYLSLIDPADENASKLDSYGRWVARDSVELERVAGALSVDFGEREFADIHGIPDLWGHALLFHQAWQGNLGRGFAAKAVAAWRGLLALFALRDFENLNMQIVPIRLNPDASDFVGMAARSRPATIFDFDENQDVHTVGGILVKEEVVGLVLRQLLVLPARECHLPPLEGIRWVRANGQGERMTLTDPTKRDRLSSAQAHALQRFLDSVAKALHDLTDGTQGPPNDGLVTLADNIEAFRRDVEQVLELHNWRGPPPVLVPDREFANRFQHREFQALHEIPGPRQKPGEESSETILKPVALLEGVLQPAVFFDPQLAASGAGPTSSGELYVWGNRTADEFKEGHLPASVEKEINNGGLRHIHGDDFFTDTLIKLSNAEVQGHPPGFREFLLPISPLALLYIEANDLREQLQIHQEGADFHVTLDLPLESPDKQGYSCRVQRVYSPQKGSVIECEPMTALGLWPNLDHEDWQRYYLYEGHDANQLQVDHAGCLALLAEQMATASNKLPLDRDTLHDELNALCLAGFDASVLSTREGDARTRVLFSRRPADFLVCRVAGGTGLLLLDKLDPAMPLDIDREMNIGFDFGTTNTSIAGDQIMASDKSQPLPLQSRIHLPLAVEGAEQQGAAIRIELAMQFLPLVDQTPPFLSLLHERRGGFEGQTGVLRDTRVGFVEHVERTLLEILSAKEQSRFRFDLKWSQPGDKRRHYVRAFLEQVVMQIAVEALARGIPLENIRWRFTRPAALSPRVEVEFRGEVYAAVSAVTRLDDEQVRERVSFHYESFAAYKYFLHHEKRITDLNILIDVGGHTTDFAIVSSTAELLWQGSVELGGQDILIDYWCAHLAEVNELFSGASNLLSQVVISSDRDPDTLRAALEIVLNDRDHAQRVWTLVQDKEKSDLVVQTRARSDFALFGIFYYILMVLGELKKGCPWIAEENQAIVFAGRGSLIFKHLANSVVQGDAAEVPVPKLLDGWFRSEGFVKGVGQISFSSQPKLEVAVGASLAGSADAGLTDPRGPVEEERFLPLGETIRTDFHAGSANEVNKRPRESLSAKDFGDHDDKVWQVRDLDTFKRFLVEIRDVLDDRVALDRLAKSKTVLNAVKTEFTAVQDILRSVKLEDRTGYIAPPFVMALRSALKAWRDVELR